MFPCNRVLECMNYIQLVSDFLLTTMNNKTTSNCWCDWWSQPFYKHTQEKPLYILNGEYLVLIKNLFRVTILPRLCVFHSATLLVDCWVKGCPVFCLVRLERCMTAPKWWRSAVLTGAAESLLPKAKQHALAHTAVGRLVEVLHPPDVLSISFRHLLTAPVIQFFKEHRRGKIHTKHKSDLTVSKRGIGKQRFKGPVCKVWLDFYFFLLVKS